jgi:hypothetical protein
MEEIYHENQMPDIPFSWYIEWLAQADCPRLARGSSLSEAWIG